MDYFWQYLQLCLLQYKPPEIFKVSIQNTVINLKKNISTVRTKVSIRGKKFQGALEQLWTITKTGVTTQQCELWSLLKVQ